MGSQKKFLLALLGLLFVGVSVIRADSYFDNRRFVLDNTRVFYLGGASDPVVVSTNLKIRTLGVATSPTMIFSAPVSVNAQATMKGGATINGNATYNNIFVYGTINFSPTSAFNMLPQNMIVIWAGDPASIPSGWRLCDGSFGTKDLRDKFVVGTGPTNLLDSEGPPTHNHGIATITNTTGVVTNTVTFFDVNFTNDNVNNDPINIVTQYSHSHTVNHTHSTSVGVNVNSQPPFYVMCYIQRTN